MQKMIVDTNSLIWYNCSFLYLYFKKIFFWQKLTLMIPIAPKCTAISSSVVSAFMPATKTVSSCVIRSASALAELPPPPPKHKQSIHSTSRALVKHIGRSEAPMEVLLHTNKNTDGARVMMSSLRTARDSTSESRGAREWLKTIINQTAMMNTTKQPKTESAETNQIEDSFVTRLVNYERIL